MYGVALSIDGIWTSSGHHIKSIVRPNKGKSLISFPDKYCVLDIETTGLSPRNDAIIEIGAVKYKGGKEAGRYNELVRPDEPDEDDNYIDSFITELTGITNEMLADSETIDRVLPKFDSFLGQSIIIGYNVNFDINFLYDNYTMYLDHALTNNFVDTMRIYRKLSSEKKHHRLKDLCEDFDISNGNAHRAVSDVLATARGYELLHRQAVARYGSEKNFVNLFKRASHSGNRINPDNIVGDSSKKDPESPLYARHCVFTGKLERFLREDAMQIVADLGGINDKGVTKKTNFLILGDNSYNQNIKDKGGKSTKLKKAEQYKLSGQDIEIVPESVFYDMISEY